MARLPLDDNRTPQWNGWSHANSNSRFQTAANAALTVDQVKRLELKWAFAFDGDVSTFTLPPSAAAP